MEYIRDYAMFTAVFGMFSFAWFGWAQEGPREHWRKYIGIASGIALLVSLLGIYLSVMNWNEATALSEVGSLTTYLIVFYAEFIIGGIVAFLLIRANKGDYVAPWICFIVGIHFIFLVNVFNDSSLYLLAILLIVISAMSPTISKKMNVRNSAITGISSGFVLFCFALFGLIRFFFA
ncbi:hypothetical protein [Geomicrobium sp. JCM 19039]|uniref:hypothetical protein n=1 Tax=Geomicrobium sp. JCM 19039 TaxID=1460636 RepID=UPI00045F4B54|nr:hypothetical protein [Geomicrobium sp. JCM 19039]GAK13134.1 hypothetical protein JCM19039_2954 [Geomicrobium sp. JCM 19039]